MNEAQVEAIANADAHTSNAGLPTYTELLRELKRIAEACELNPLCPCNPATSEVIRDSIKAVFRV